VRANTGPMTTRDISATIDDQLVRRWERLEHGLARSLEQSRSRREHQKPRRRRLLGRLFSRSR
jgi:hypothetical protein